MKRRAASLYKKSRDKINALQTRWNGIKERAGKLAAVNELASDMNNGQTSISVDAIRTLLMRATPNIKVSSVKRTTSESNEISVSAKTSERRKNSKDNRNKKKRNNNGRTKLA